MVQGGQFKTKKTLIPSANIKLWLTQTQQYSNVLNERWLWIWSMIMPFPIHSYFDKCICIKWSNFHLLNFLNSYGMLPILKGIYVASNIFGRGADLTFWCKRVPGCSLWLVVGGWWQHRGNNHKPGHHQLFAVFILYITCFTFQIFKY